jgi:hypothetical protein
MMIRYRLIGAVIEITGYECSYAIEPQDNKGGTT